MSADRDPRLLAVADSDSYLKWAASTIAALPPPWRTEVAVVRSPITPSPAQVEAALPPGAPPPRLVRAGALPHVAGAFGPDVVLVACTGPVAELVMGRLLRRLSPRPAWVAGLPGIAVHDPGTAWRNRAAADLLVVHSHVERAVVARLCQQLGIEARIALSHLPFLDGRPPAAPGSARRVVVFAPQALAPAGRSEREQVLLALADAAAGAPDLQVVVKLRGRGDEQQTHNEAWDYERLWADLVRRGRVEASAVAFAAGPMAGHLRHAVGLVTVGSTAALEAIAAGVPVLVLGDFGVGPATLNGVFQGSGCIGTLDDLRATRFSSPRQEWLRWNYFHPRSDDDLEPHLAELAATARSGAIGPAAPSRSGAVQRLRARARLAVPQPAVPLARRLRRPPG